MTCLGGVRLWLGMVGVAAAVGTGCGANGSNAAADDEQAATSGADGGSDTQGDEGQGNLSDEVPGACDPGAVRCVGGGGGLETCAGTGLEWEFDPCPSNTVCVACGPDDPCVEDRCLGPCESTSGVPSSAGCEFIANRQLHLLPDVPDAVIVANPNEDAEATVEFFEIADGENVEVLAETVTLAPGEDHTLLIDNTFVPGTSSLLRSGGMIRIRSDLPVVAYQHSPYKNHVGNDSSLLLPDSVLGKVYVVPSYNPHVAQHEGKGLPSYFEVIALKKNTWVEWTPPVPTAGQGAQIDAGGAGETVRKAELNRYDTIRITASNEFEDDYPGIARDLSGTVIRASDPVWVVGASRCSRVPVREEPVGGFCDPLQEVLIPVQYWGTEYVAMHPPLRENESHHWRVYAGNDDVTFTTDPQVLNADNCVTPAVFDDGACTLPQLGSWIEITVPNGESFVVKGERAPDDALMVVGYLQSKQHPGEPDDTSTTVGDPAMFQTIATEQFLGRYVFRTAEGYDPPENDEGEPLPVGTKAGNYVQIIRRVGGASVFLDQQGVNVWERVGEFEFATVRIKTGAHTVESNETVGVSLFGFSNQDIEDPQGCLNEDGRCASSYAYPGGMRSLQIFTP